MKYFLILLTLLTSKPVRSQTPEDSVKQTVNKMFAAMKNANGILLKSSFADSAILQTIIQSKDGNILVKNESLSEFIDFISKQSPGAADERITFGTIKVDGPLAMAWTPYNFYFNTQFSHCGINSFQLVQLLGEWKIQYIIEGESRTVKVIKGTAWPKE